MKSMKYEQLKKFGLSIGDILLAVTSGSRWSFRFRWQSRKSRIIVKKLKVALYIEHSQETSFCW